ncbi:MAG: metallophosphoesterase family protein [Bryobacteraceae bacterium]
MLTLLGLISDTHGLLRPEAIQALRGSHLIIHAGDIGNPEILPRLNAIAPVVAVRGNVDTGKWAAGLPETAIARAGDIQLYVLHDVGELDLNPRAAGFDIVVSGHSHEPEQEVRKGVLYINPGSAGPRRFRLPVTVARLDLNAKPWQAEFVRLDGSTSPRD